jgi:hypothetical protein
MNILDEIMWMVGFVLAHLSRPGVKLDIECRSFYIVFRSKMSTRYDSVIIEVGMKSMRYRILSIFLLWILATTAGAQTIPDSMWTKYYQVGTWGSTVYDLNRLGNNGYVLVRGVQHRWGGPSYSYHTMDLAGHTMTDYEYSPSPSGFSWCVDLFETSEPGRCAATADGGIALAEDERECVYAGMGQYYTGYAFRVRNYSADHEWIRRYSAFDSVSAVPEGARDIVRCADGGYAVTGYISSIGNGQKDIYVVRTDSAGTRLWARSFGGALDDIGYAIKPCYDGGFILCGTTQSYGAGSTDGFLLKVNSSGDSLWMRTYGRPADDAATNVDIATDGGFIISCNGLYDLVRTDSVGYSLWTKSCVTGFRTIESTDDGGFVGVSGSGRMYRFGAYGDTIWTLAYPGLTIEDAHATFDGGFILAGQYLGGDGYYYDKVIKTRPEAGLRVLVPNGGENWHTGHVDTIRWFGGGVGNSVRIELNRFYPHGSWETLVGSGPNDSREAYLVGGPPSTSCRIRVSSMPGGVTDVSDRDFTISSSQGYLALVCTSELQQAVTNWSRQFECPNDTIEFLRLRNFGSEPLSVYAIQPVANSPFGISPLCPSPLTLLPGQVSDCVLQLSFEPRSEGTYLDTLWIQTDAINTTNGYVQIPLRGVQTRTPASPRITIQASSGGDAELSWNRISESINGCPINVTGYLVFYSPSAAGPFYYHGYTRDASYLHTRVMHYNFGMYYQVMATTDPAVVLDMLLPPPSKAATTQAQVISILQSQR